MKDDERTKELIAIGASISAHCQPCLEYHMAKARELGINEKCIRTAIEIGFMVENGASNAMHNFVDELMSRVDEKSKKESGGVSGCCG
jgi:AhpD family alkylhydroperoxidase